MKKFKIDVSFTIEITADSYGEAVRIAANTYRNAKEVRDLKIGFMNHEEASLKDYLEGSDYTNPYWFDDDAYEEDKDILEEGEDGKL